MTPTKKSFFIQGPIASTLVAQVIDNHSSKTDIGAHTIFLGQVRSDLMEGKKVKAIDFQSYQALAEETIFQIKEAAFQKFQLTCLHIYHSLGEVQAGQLCFFVFVSSKHRTTLFEACSSIVSEIKNNVPIWGKELFDDNTHKWKVNKQ